VRSPSAPALAILSGAAHKAVARSLAFLVAPGVLEDGPVDTEHRDHVNAPAEEKAPRRLLNRAAVAAGGHVPPLSIPAPTVREPVQVAQVTGDGSPGELHGGHHQAAGSRARPEGVAGFVSLATIL
jgi:hypothetical protein